MISEKQKNINILSRFDTKETGTKVVAYKVTVDNKEFAMICMNGENLEQAIKSCKGVFGNRLQGVRC